MDKTAIIKNSSANEKENSEDTAESAVRTAGYIDCEYTLSTSWGFWDAIAGIASPSGTISSHGRRVANSVDHRSRFRFFSPLRLLAIRYTSELSFCNNRHYSTYIQKLKIYCINRPITPLRAIRPGVGRPIPDREPLQA